MLQALMIKMTEQFGTVADTPSTATGGNIV